MRRPGFARTGHAQTDLEQRSSEEEQQEAEENKATEQHFSFSPARFIPKAEAARRENGAEQDHQIQKIEERRGHIGKKLHRLHQRRQSLTCGQVIQAHFLTPDPVGQHDEDDNKQQRSQQKGMEFPSVSGAGIEGAGVTGKRHRISSVRLIRCTGGDGSALKGKAPAEMSGILCADGRVFVASILPIRFLRRFENHPGKTESRVACMRRPMRFVASD